MYTHTHTAQRSIPDQPATLWTRINRHSQECKKHTPTLFLCLMTSTYDCSTPKYTGFSGILVEHFSVKFGDRSCTVFLDIVRKKQQTDKQTPLKSYPSPRLPSTWENKNYSPWLPPLWTYKVNARHTQPQYNTMPGTTGLCKSQSRCQVNSTRDTADCCGWDTSVGLLVSLEQQALIDDFPINEADIARNRRRRNACINQYTAMRRVSAVL